MGNNHNNKDTYITMPPCRSVELFIEKARATKTDCVRSFWINGCNMQSYFTFIYSWVVLSPKLLYSKTVTIFCIVIYPSCCCLEFISLIFWWWALLPQHNLWHLVTSRHPSIFWQINLLQNTIVFSFWYQTIW